MPTEIAGISGKEGMIGISSRSPRMAKLQTKQENANVD